MQLCGNQIAGCEAAVHAMKEMFKDEGTQGVLLVDATNAFNCLNRNVALHNIQFNCPEIATILINTHRRPPVLMIDRQAGADPEIEEGGGYTYRVGIGAR